MAEREGREGKREREFVTSVSLSLPRVMIRGRKKLYTIIKGIFSRLRNQYSPLRSLLFILDSLLFIYYLRLSYFIVFYVCGWVGVESVEEIIN